MNTWQPISEAPTDGTIIEIARFIDHKGKTDIQYIVSASWGFEMHSYTHNASQSGWIFGYIPESLGSSLRGEVIRSGFIGYTAPPTHYRLIDIPNLKQQGK